jgi:hypothetical protein
MVVFFAEWVERFVNRRASWLIDLSRVSGYVIWGFWIE